jgi:hypothetical protein
MGLTAAQPAHLFLSSAHRMLNADTVKGAMVVSALCRKTRGDLLASTIQIVRTTKFARTPFALVVVTLLGCLTTEVSLNLSPRFGALNSPSFDSCVVCFQE